MIVMRDFFDVKYADARIWFTRCVCSAYISVLCSRI